MGEPSFDLRTARREVAFARAELAAARTWRHTRTSGVYWVRTVVIEESTGQPLVIYTHVETGLTWARPAKEFLDGRFVPHEHSASP